MHNTRYLDYLWSSNVHLLESAAIGFFRSFNESLLHRFVVKALLHRIRVQHEHGVRRSLVSSLGLKDQKPFS